MLKRLISRAAVWAGLRNTTRGGGRQAVDPQLEREIQSSLSDEALAWAVGSWRKRYL